MDSKHDIKVPSLTIPLNIPILYLSNNKFIYNSILLERYKTVGVQTDPPKKNIDTEYDLTDHDSDWEKIDIK